MHTVADVFHRTTSLMLAPRELRGLPGHAAGYAIIGAAGYRAHVTAVTPRPAAAAPVVVRVRITDVNGWPVGAKCDFRHVVFQMFTGMINACPAPQTGGWSLAFDPNGDPLTVTAPPAPRRDWRTALTRAAFLI